MEALIGVLECGGFLTILLADVIQEFCVQRGKAKTKSTLLVSRICVFVDSSEK